jgi:hypothetical protein
MFATIADPPARYPPFPQPSGYPANFFIAHNTISSKYQHALQVSAQEDADPLQLIFHYDVLTNGTFPLLEAISEDPAANEPDLGDWLITATTALALVSKRLEIFRTSLGNR